MLHIYNTCKIYLASFSYLTDFFFFWGGVKFCWYTWYAKCWDTVALFISWESEKWFHVCFLDETDVVAITNSFMNHKPLIMLLFIKCNMFLQLGAVTTGFVHSECTARQKPPVGKRERVFHGFCIVDPQHEGKAIYSPLNYAWHLQLLTIWILAVTLSLMLWMVKHC